MKFSPYSIGHTPRALPIWQTVMDTASATLL